MSQSMQPETRLYHFLQEIYGDQPTMTRVEVDVEGMSGGAYGIPHLETTEVRVYAGDAQLLPNFEKMTYWKEMLAAYPNLFQECTTHQGRLQAVQKLLKRECVYLDYGLDWPDINERVASPLRFNIEELRQMASTVVSIVEVLDKDEEVDSDRNDLGGKDTENGENEYGNTSKEAQTLPYAYIVSLTTHQILYQDVVVESAIPLSEDETIERAFALAENKWEPGPIDENPDVDQVQNLRAEPGERKEQSSSSSS